MISKAYSSSDLFIHPSIHPSLPCLFASHLCSLSITLSHSHSLCLCFSLSLSLSVSLSLAHLIFCSLGPSLFSPLPIHFSFIWILNTIIDITTHVAFIKLNTTSIFSSILWEIFKVGNNGPYVSLFPVPLCLPHPYFCCCSVTQSCTILCDAMDCSMPGFPVLHHLPQLAQTHIHHVGDTIQSSCPLLPLFLLPSILPSISVFSNESALCIR